MSMKVSVRTEGNLIPLGEPTDAKSTATDVTSASIIAILKQISASAQALVAPGLSASVSVTRPSDTSGYTAGDVLGPTGGGTAALDFNLGAVSGSKIKIQGVSLERDVTAVISGETTYALYLYSVTPPSAPADNAAFDIPAGDRASFLGKIAIPQIIDEVSTLYIETNNLQKIVQLAGTHLFGLLVTVGAYAPASASVLKITLVAEQL